MTVIYTLEKYENNSWVVIVTVNDDYSEAFSWYKALERAHPYDDYRIQKHVTYVTLVTP